MGNQQSVSIEELQHINEKQRSIIIDLEQKLKTLDKENHELKKEIKKYEKRELFSTSPRPERDDDVL